MASKLDRTIKVIENYTLLFTASFLEGFSDLSLGLVSGIAKGLGGKFPEKEKLKKEAFQKIKSFIKQLKQDFNIQFSGQKGKIKKILNDKACDECLAIVDKYPFSLPRLDEELDDLALAGYLAFLAKEDKQIISLFYELKQWSEKLNGLGAPKSK